MKKIVFFMYGIGVFIMFFVLSNFGTSDHEAVHKQIMTYDSCDNVTVKQNYFTASGYAVCETQGYNESKEALVLNGFNEVVSYNINSIVVCFFLLIIVIGVFGLLILDKLEDSKNV